VLTDGLPAVEAACSEAIAQGVHSADVVLNILARLAQSGAASHHPDTGRTDAAPHTDCRLCRYDNLRRTV
jgi:hypothetical protein